MNLRSVIGTSLFIALGLVLPTIFHLISSGNILLPMHIPVILCGFCFGSIYGLICGILTPLISSVFSGMPVLFPTGIFMMVELGCYGFFSGLFYQKYHLNVYIALILSMLTGRAVNALVSYIFYPIFGLEFSFGTFLTASFVTALPGIVIQILIIPVIVAILKQAKIINSTQTEKIKKV